MILAACVALRLIATRRPTHRSRKLLRYSALAASNRPCAYAWNCGWRQAHRRRRQRAAGRRPPGCSGTTRPAAGVNCRHVEAFLHLRVVGELFEEVLFPELRDELVLLGLQAIEFSIEL